MYEMVIVPEQTLTSPRSLRLFMKKKKDSNTQIPVDLNEILLQANEMEWRPKSLKGVHEKMLWRNEETEATVALIKFEKGVGIPKPHAHDSNQMMYCLQGKYEYLPTGLILTAGSFYCNPKGMVHGPTIAHEETIVVEIYDGPHYPTMPSWYTDERDAH